MTDSPETHPDPQPTWSQWCRGWCWGLIRRILVYYLGFVLLLSLLQRQMLYVPTPADALPVRLAGLPPGSGEDITVTTADGLQLHGWHLLPRGTSAVDAAGFERSMADSLKVVLFFPGNGGNRRHRDTEFQLLTGLGMHVIAFDYRGYGENPGQPSEANFAADAKVIWKYLTETRHVTPDRIVIYGESLGGGVATRLAADLCAAKTPPAGLILRSTFSSMVAAASYHYPWVPVSLVLKDRYRSDQRIPSMTAPLLMLHGRLDSIVPLKLGEQLFKLAHEKSANGIAKQFVELPASDHNDTLDADRSLIEESLSKFLKRIEHE